MVLVLVGGHHFTSKGLLMETPKRPPWYTPFHKHGTGLPKGVFPDSHVPDFACDSQLHQLGSFIHRISAVAFWSGSFPPPHRLRQRSPDPPAPEEVVFDARRFAGDTGDARNGWRGPWRKRGPRWGR